MQTILGANSAVATELAKELKKHTDNIRLVSRNLFVLFVILFSNNLFGQWGRTNGPSGAAISDIEKVGSSIAVVTVYGESYFSEDQGTNWIERSGLPFSFAPRLTTRGNQLIAATQGGVFVTSDLGETWNQLSVGMGNAYIRGIAVKDNILFAVSDDFPTDQIYRYDDANQAWQIVGSISTTFPLTVYNMFSYNNFLYLSNSSTIFSGSEVVFRSSDNGSTWQDISSGLPNGAFNFSHHQNQIFVSTVNGVYKSTNSGNSWTAAGLGNYRIYGLEISGDTLYAGSSGSGLFRSINLGNSWQGVGLSDKWVYDVKAFNDNIFVGTNFVGMFKTTNSGLEWELINNGINGMPVNSFVQSNGVLIAGAFGGLFISTDMGNNWQDKGKNFPPILTQPSLGGSHLVYDVTIDTTSNIIYAGGLGAVYKSSDNGDNWSLVGESNLGSGRVEALDVSYVNPNEIKVFAGLGTGSDSIGLHYSINQGQSWRLENFGLQYPYILDTEIKNDFIYAGGGYSVNGGVRRSSDNGISWQTINNGLPSEIAVEALFALGINIFAATDNGVFRSTDNGNNWSLVWNNGSVTGFTSDLKNYIYASSANTGLRGIYRSTDNGASWQPFNEGFIRLPESVFSITYRNGYLFAGVDRLGVWKRQVDNPTDIINGNMLLPEEFILEQNYPNPFNPSTRINYTTPNTGFVSLKVFDVLGNEIATLVNEEKSAGAYVVNWNANNLPSGIYVYKMQAGSFTSVKKMMLVK
jgi:photosystem II stability/assembly factor-like uncharacterized protein